MKYYKGFLNSYHSTDKAYAIDTWYNQTSRRQHFVFVPKSQCKRDENQSNIILIPAWLVANNDLWNYVTEDVNKLEQLNNSDSFNVLIETMVDYLEDGDTFEEFLNDKYVNRHIKRLLNDHRMLSRNDITDELKSKLD